MPEYHTIQQAARRMGLPDQTVRDLCQSGELTGAIQEREGRPWRIPVESVDTWIEEGVARRRRKRFITITGIATTIGIVIALVSGLADWDKAIVRLHQWGILRSYAPAESGETLIIVFDFYTTENVIDTNISNEISRAIQDEARKNELSNIRVEIDPRQLDSEEKEQAKKIGSDNNASMVVWGQDTGIRVTVNFLNTKNPELALADIQIDEAQRSQIARPTEYATFITENLPKQLTALSLFALGQSFTVDGQFNEAINLFTSGISTLDSEDSFKGREFAYDYLGLLYFYTNNYDSALTAVNEAIKINPQNASPYVTRGIVYGANSQMDKSMTDFSTALELGADKAIIYYNRGQNYAYANQLDLAIIEFKKVIDTDPNFVYAYYNLGLVYFHQGKYNEALEYFTETIQKDNNFKSAYVNRSGIYLILGNYDNAIDDATKAIKISPNDKAAYTNRISAYIALERWKDAISDLSRLNKIDPNDSYGYCKLGYIYNQLGDTEQAIVNFEGCIARMKDAKVKEEVEKVLLELRNP